MRQPAIHTTEEFEQALAGTPQWAQELEKPRVNTRLRHATEV